MNVHTLMAIVRTHTYGTTAISEVNTKRVLMLRPFQQYCGRCGTEISGRQVPCSDSKCRTTWNRVATVGNPQQPADLEGLRRLACQTLATQPSQRTFVGIHGFGLECVPTRDIPEDYESEMPGSPARCVFPVNRPFRLSRWSICYFQYWRSVRRSAD